MTETTATGTESAITTRQLRLSYGANEALHGIDLKICAGAVSGVIGPSGCGKTTLLRCFNRINERYDNVTPSGEVVIHDRNIYDADVDLIELRKAVGMVFQRPNPLPISIRDNVLYGYRLHTPRAQRSLAQHPWPGGRAVRVRMGLHTGEPTFSDLLSVGPGDDCRNRHKQEASARSSVFRKFPVHVDSPLLARCRHGERWLLCDQAGPQRLTG